MNQFSRTEFLLGENSSSVLKNSTVAVFGIGGVGGYVVEALVRAGVGTLHLIDNDSVSLTNLNRQIIATHKTIGMAKVDAAAQRAIEINPEINIITHNIFYSPDSANDFDFSEFDYIVDAIDNVTGKISLALKAQEYDIKIISSMGTGNKVHPELFEVADIYKTSVCPLARVMRTELRKRGVKSLKVVYSKEKPLTPVIPSNCTEDFGQRRSVPGSTPFVPPVAGLIIAGEVIKDLLEYKD